MKKFKMEFEKKYGWMKEGVVSMSDECYKKFCHDVFKKLSNPITAASVVAVMNGWRSEK